MVRIRIAPVGQPRAFSALVFVSRIAMRAAIVLSIVVIARASEPTGDAPTGRFLFKEVGDTSLGLWEGDKPVFVYNHDEMVLPGVSRARPRACYVHPIYGLDGEILTDDFPRDHYHHHGLFWAWPHVRVDSQDYDLWLGRGIRQEFVRWLNQDARGNGATLGVENVWIADDRPVMREKVTFEVHPASNDSRSIDIELTWTPIEEPVTLRGAAEKSYGGLSLRFAPRKETTITTPEGPTSHDLLMTKLPWADFSGQFTEAETPSGAALFVHPSHRDFPPEWLTRHFGLLAIGWPGVDEQTLPAGESYTARYRLWIHRGAPNAAKIGRAYDAYQSTNHP